MQADMEVWRPPLRTSWIKPVFSLYRKTYPTTLPALALRRCGLQSVDLVPRQAASEELIGDESVFGSFLSTAVILAQHSAPVLYPSQRTYD
jgi:hypothetical protein